MVVQSPNSQNPRPQTNFNQGNQQQSLSAQQQISQKLLQQGGLIQAAQQQVQQQNQQQGNQQKSSQQFRPPSQAKNQNNLDQNPQAQQQQIQQVQQPGNYQQTTQQDNTFGLQQNQNSQEQNSEKPRAKSSKLQEYKNKLEAYRQTEAYKKYHGPDPIRTKPYNYEQMCMHEQIYNKAAYFKFKEWKIRDENYDKNWVQKRPKQWKDKPNPNQWFNNSNANSFHGQGLKMKQKNKNPNQVFSFVNHEGTDKLTVNQSVPYKRLYIDYDNINPPRLETDYMNIEHQVFFQKDERYQGRVTPYYQTEIKQFNENMPYSVQANQNNIYNQFVNYGADPDQYHQDVYGNQMCFTQPQWHPQAQMQQSYSVNQNFQQNYPFNQYKFY